MNVFEEKINFGPIAKLYLKNWRLVLFTVLVCTSLSLIVSLLITPRYKAKASFFIPYNISYDLAIENPQFGYDVEADRLLQIIQSVQLQDSVSERFDLIQYFDIDTSNFDWKERLSEKYAKRIYANRTNVMSIIIETETHDPYFSAEIVKYVVDLSQRMRERMLKTNSQLSVDAFEKEYLKKKHEVDSLRARIIILRKELKSNPVALVNSQFLWGNNNATAANPEIMVELEVLTQKHINEHNRLNDLKGKYENALNLHKRNVPKFYVLDPPTPHFKKVFPMTAFNLVVAFLGSLFFMLVGLYVKYVASSIRKYLAV